MLVAAYYMFQSPTNDHLLPPRTLPQRTGAFHKVPTWTTKRIKNRDTKLIKNKHADKNTDGRTVASFPESSWAAAAAPSAAPLPRCFMEKPGSQTAPTAGWISALKILHFLCAEMEISILTQSRNMINCWLPESRREGNKPDWRSFSLGSCVCKHAS